MRKSSVPKSEVTQENDKKHFTGKPEKFLTFELEDEQYGIDVLKVREIIRVMSITPVPQSTEQLKGIINGSIPRL